MSSGAPTNSNNTTNRPRSGAGIGSGVFKLRPLHEIIREEEQQQQQQQAASQRSSASPPNSTNTTTSPRYNVGGIPAARPIGLSGIGMERFRQDSTVDGGGSNYTAGGGVGGTAPTASTRPPLSQRPISASIAAKATNPAQFMQQQFLRRQQQEEEQRKMKKNAEKEKGGGGSTADGRQATAPSSLNTSVVNGTAAAAVAMGPTTGTATAMGSGATALRTDSYGGRLTRTNTDDSTTASTPTAGLGGRATAPNSNALPLSRTQSPRPISTASSSSLQQQQHEKDAKNTSNAEDNNASTATDNTSATVDDYEAQKAAEEEAAANAKLAAITAAIEAANAKEVAAQSLLNDEILRTTRPSLLVNASAVVHNHTIGGGGGGINISSSNMNMSSAGGGMHQPPPLFNASTAPSTIVPTPDTETVHERLRALIEWRIISAVKSLYPDDAFNNSIKLRVPVDEGHRRVFGESALPALLATREGGGGGAKGKSSVRGGGERKGGNQIINNPSLSPIVRRPADGEYGYHHDDNEFGNGYDGNRSSSTVANLTDLDDILDGGAGITDEHDESNTNKEVMDELLAGTAARLGIPHHQHHHHQDYDENGQQQDYPHHTAALPSSYYNHQPLFSTPLSQLLPTDVARKYDADIITHRTALDKVLRRELQLLQTQIKFEQNGIDIATKEMLSLTIEADRLREVTAVLTMKTGEVAHLQSVAEGIRRDAKERQLERGNVYDSDPEEEAEDKNTDGGGGGMSTKKAAPPPTAASATLTGAAVTATLHQHRSFADAYAKLEDPEEKKAAAELLMMGMDGGNSNPITTKNISSKNNNPRKQVGFAEVVLDYQKSSSQFAGGGRTAFSRSAADDVDPHNDDHEAPINVVVMNEATGEPMMVPNSSSSARSSRRPSAGTKATGRGVRGGNENDDDDDDDDMLDESDITAINNNSNSHHHFHHQYQQQQQLEANALERSVLKASHTAVSNVTNPLYNTFLATLQGHIGGGGGGGGGGGAERSNNNNAKFPTTADASAASEDHFDVNFQKLMEMVPPSAAAATPATGHLNSYTNYTSGNNNVNNSSIHNNYSNSNINANIDPSIRRQQLAKQHRREELAMAKDLKRTSERTTRNLMVELKKAQYQRLLVEASSGTGGGGGGGKGGGATTTTMMEATMTSSPYETVARLAGTGGDFGGIGLGNRDKNATFIVPETAPSPLGGPSPTTSLSSALLQQSITHEQHIAQQLAALTTRSYLSTRYMELNETASQLAVVRSALRLESQWTAEVQREAVRQTNRHLNFQTFQQQNQQSQRGGSRSGGHNHTNNNNNNNNNNSAEAILATVKQEHERMHKRDFLGHRMIAQTYRWLTGQEPINSKRHALEKTMAEVDTTAAGGGGRGGGGARSLASHYLGGAEADSDSDKDPMYNSSSAAIYLDPARCQPIINQIRRELENGDVSLLLKMAETECEGLTETAEEAWAASASKWY